jgi:hypothetical protein
VAGADGALFGVAGVNGALIGPVTVCIHASSGIVKVDVLGLRGNLVFEIKRARQVI